MARLPPRLTISGLSANNKTYNAMATDTLSGTANLLQAEAAGSGSTSDGMPYVGDKVTLGGTAIGTFQSKNVGTSSVTVSGNILGGPGRRLCARQRAKRALGLHHRQDVVYFRSWREQQAIRRDHQGDVDRHGGAARWRWLWRLDKMAILTMAMR